MSVTERTNTSRVSGSTGHGSMDPSFERVRLAISRAKVHIEEYGANAPTNAMRSRMDGWAAARRYIGSPDQVVVGGRDVVDIFRHQATISHRWGPVDDCDEAEARERRLEARDLRVVDAEGNDA
jgi:hypothetical protein